MKTIEFSYGPVVLNLYMNGSAMFDIQALEDASDAQADIFDRMNENTADGFSLTCKLAHILATQGELCRRYLQYQPRRIPDALELTVLLSPAQMMALRIAVMNAVNAGYSKGKEDDGGDIDTGLAELEKKTNL